MAVRPIDAYALQERLYRLGLWNDSRAAFYELIESMPTLTPPNEKPPCYLPEKDNPYPLCEGRGMKVCAHCCLWEDYDPEEDEGRVNRPLTLEQLREMDGEPVWLDVAGGMWALVDALDGCLWLDRGGSIDIAKFAGKAYRRPKEEQ